MTEHPRAARTAELEFSLAATAQDVWRALTDARELGQWFPEAAEVSPGEGGTLSFRWGTQPPIRWRILAWEPPPASPADASSQQRAHLRLGMPAPGRLDAPAPNDVYVATDFFIAADGGNVTLRVVASGFDADAQWSDYFDAVARGWRFELTSLLHYLNHHRDRARSVAWARVPSDLVPNDAWVRLTGRGGWSIEAPQLAIGAPYTMQTPTGERFSGSIRVLDPPFEFCGMVSELNNGLVRLTQHRAARCETGVSLSAYDVDRDAMGRRQEAWQEALLQLLTPSTAAPIGGDRPALASTMPVASTLSSPIRP
jgi:hypothetical protein